MRTLTALVLAASFTALSCCSKSEPIEWCDPSTHETVYGEVVEDYTPPQNCRTIDDAYAQPTFSSLGIVRMGGDWIFDFSPNGTDSTYITFDAKTLEEGINHLNMHLDSAQTDAIGIYATHSAQGPITKADVTYMRTHINSPCIGINR
jgi:hypothetical protein